jgi:hypothetical protein
MSGGTAEVRRTARKRRSVVLRADFISLGIENGTADAPRIVTRDERRRVLREERREKIREHRTIVAKSFFDSFFSTGAKLCVRPKEAAR